MHNIVNEIHDRVTNLPKTKQCCKEKLLYALSAQGKGLRRTRRGGWRQSLQCAEHLLTKGELFQAEQGREGRVGHGDQLAHVLTARLRADNPVSLRQRSADGSRWAPQILRLKQWETNAVRRTWVSTVQIVKRIAHSVGKHSAKYHSKLRRFPVFIESCAKPFLDPHA